jgi:hypothetical protein
MTRVSKLHIILVFITLMVSVLKGQPDILQSRLNNNSMIPIQMVKDGLSIDYGLSLITPEIIPYRIVPSDNPLYGCWSELEVIWPEYLSNENREKLSITIINQELHNDIPDYVEIGNKHYYMMKLPMYSVYDQDELNWWRN